VDLDPVLIANVRWLSRYRHRRCLVPGVAALLLEAFDGGRGDDPLTAVTLSSSEQQGCLDSYPNGVMTGHPVRGLPGSMQAQNETADGFVITIRGAAGPAVRAALEDMKHTGANDTTVLHRSSGDQAALYGILQRVQDLGTSHRTDSRRSRSSLIARTN